MYRPRASANDLTNLPGLLPGISTLHSRSTVAIFDLLSFRFGCADPATLISPLHPNINDASQNRRELFKRDSSADGGIRPVPCDVLVAGFGGSDARRATGEIALDNRTFRYVPAASSRIRRSLKRSEASSHQTKQQSQPDQQSVNFRASPSSQPAPPHASVKTVEAKAFIDKFNGLSRLVFDARWVDGWDYEEWIARKRSHARPGTMHNPGVGPNGEWGFVLGSEAEEGHVGFSERMSAVPGRKFWRRDRATVSDQSDDGVAKAEKDDLVDRNIGNKPATTEETHLPDDTEVEHKTTPFAQPILFIESVTVRAYTILSWRYGIGDVRKVNGV